MGSFYSIIVGERCRDPILVSEILSKRGGVHLVSERGGVSLVSKRGGVSLVSKSREISFVSDRE